MLASPLLLSLLLFSFISAISTFVLLLLPILPSLSFPSLFPRTLPRSYYPHLTARPSTRTSSSISSLVHSVGIVLAGTELVVTSLALWQQLLLYSNAGKKSGQDDVGEGIRMGLSLVLRPIVWTSVVIFILLKNSRRSSSSSQDRSFSSVSTLSTKRTFVLTGGIVLAAGTLVALFAGVSSASLSSSYGVALVSSLLLLVLGTAGMAGIFLQTLRLERKSRRTSSIKIGRGEKDAFRKGEWKAEEKAVFVEKPQEFGRRGEGWGDGASWLSSPTASNASLPAFDLSLTPTSARNSAANISTSRPTTPYGTRVPSPHPQTPLDHPSRINSPTSWLSSPDEHPRTMSSFSFDSSYQSARTANITDASSAFHQAPGPPTPLYSTDTFAALTPVLARPPSRAVSKISSRTSYLPLSPPPAVPLPPTPSRVAQSDGRPSTSTEFRVSFSDWTRPSTNDFASTDAFTSVVGFGSTQPAMVELKQESKEVAGRASEDVLMADGGRRRKERFSRDEELGRAGVAELDEADYRRPVRRSWLGVACVVFAWTVWALALPSMLDCISHPTTHINSAMTLTLILSFTISSPITLVLYLLFRSASFASSTASSYDSVSPYNHQRRANARLSTRTVSGLSFSDGPVRPSVDLAPPVPDKRTGGGKGLRPLTLVGSNLLGLEGGFRGRSLSPNEEGNMGDVWINNRQAKGESSRWSRALSMLGPNPPLHQLPSSRISYTNMPTPPPRAASPAFSFASSASSRASASHLSGLQEDPQETFATFRTRAQSAASSIHRATVQTAQRGTRASIGMGKLVDFVESPSASTTEFGGPGWGEVRVVEGRRENGLSLDWMTANILPNLVPSIRIGKNVQVRGEVKIRPSAQEVAPASILRTRSAYEPRTEPEEEDLELTPRRPTTIYGSTRHAHDPTPPSSTNTTPRSDPRARTAGAQAPTPSHGRSSSIEVKGFALFFNSPSVQASTPIRSATQRVRARPISSDDNRTHKSHFSLPPVIGGRPWGEEVRQALDRFGGGPRGSLRSRRSYSVVDVQDNDDLSFLPPSVRRSTFGASELPLDSVSEDEMGAREEEEEELSADEFEFGLDGFGDLEVVSYEDESSHVMVNAIPYQDGSALNTGGLNSSGGNDMSRELDDLLAEMEVVGSRSHRSLSAPGDASLPRTVSPPHSSFEDRNSYHQQSLQSAAPTHIRQASEHDFEAGSPRHHYQPTLTLHRNASLASTTTSFSTMSSPSPSPVAHRSTNHTHGGSLGPLKSIAETTGRHPQSSSLSMLQARSTARIQPSTNLSVSAPNPSPSFTTTLRPLALLQQPQQFLNSNSASTKSNGPTATKGSNMNAPIRRKLTLLGENDENHDPSSIGSTRTSLENPSRAA